MKKKKMGLIEDRRMAWRGALKGTGRSVGHVGQHARSNIRVTLFAVHQGQSGGHDYCLVDSIFLEFYMRGIFN